jgi:hypothetical protein
VIAVATLIYTNIRRFYPRQSYGALIGRELRAQGYNMTLGGGTNITREPRNGRTFE